MELSAARGQVNEILFEIDFSNDFETGQPVHRYADAIIRGELFTSPPSEYLKVIDVVLAAGRLPTPAEKLSRRFSEAELLEFLRALGGELRSRLASGASG